MDSTISALTGDAKGHELKRKLLECLDKESDQFSSEIQQYFSKDVLSKADKADLLKAIIAAINHVVESGDWNSSLFLKNTLKPLNAIKAEAEAELLKLEAKVTAKIYHIEPPAEDEVEVYISLFQSEGLNINKWAMQLRSLERYVVGRPIYRHAVDIEKRIRLRSLAGNEAYVSVIIKKLDIQPSVDPFAASLKDQFDHPLLMVKDIALRKGRITGFCHQGIRYYFVDGRLIKVD